MTRREQDERGNREQRQRIRPWPAVSEPCEQRARSLCLRPVHDACTDHVSDRDERRHIAGRRRFDGQGRRQQQSRWTLPIRWQRHDYEAACSTATQERGEIMSATARCDGHARKRNAHGDRCDRRGMGVRRIRNPRCHRCSDRPI